MMKLFGKGKKADNNSGADEKEENIDPILGKKWNKEIESKMKKSYEESKRVIRILFLGPGDSGKTTVIKQMQKIHTGEIPQHQRAMYAEFIQTSAVTHMRAVCNACLDFCRAGDEKTAVDDSLAESMGKLLQLEDSSPLDKPTVETISKLWKDGGIQATWDQRSKFLVPDNAGYFFSNIDRVAKPDYVPTFEDVLRMRQRSSGYHQQVFSSKIPNLGSHKFELTDVGGQRSERKKWMKIMHDNINAVVYITAISEYDQVCFEDSKTLRVHEALDLFEKVMAAGFFEEKSVIIFFNKYDLFLEKIKKVAISDSFPDFPKNQDANSPEAAVKFLASKFLDLFNGRNIKLLTPIHIHQTSALDTGNIQKVFKDIIMDLVRLNLRNCGMLV